MNNKKGLQEAEYFLPYHHALKKNKKTGIFYFSLINLIKERINKFKAKKILDFGCGDGKLINELSKNQNLNLTGIDISKRAISFAKIFTPLSSFIHNDLMKYNPQLKFDMIITMETLEHIPPEELPKIINKLNELLVDEGYLMITVPSTNIKTSRKHFQHFNQNSIKELLKDKFEIKGHMKKSKIYDYLYAFSDNNLFSINLKIYQLFLEKYFKKHLENSDINKCRGLIITSKKIKNES